MSVSDTELLPRLDFILFDRAAGKNVIGHAIDTIERLRADNAIYEEQEIRMECWIEQRDAEIKLLRAALWRSAPPERKP
jgi:hypothetical protein